MTTLGATRAQRRSSISNGRCAPTAGSAATSCRATWTRVGHIEELRADADFHWLTVSFPPAAGAATSCIEGSIAVDGISLTVAGLGDDRFDVQVVPFTLEHTNLQPRAGSRPRQPRMRHGRQVRRARGGAGRAVARPGARGPGEALIHDDKDEDRQRRPQGARSVRPDRGRRRGVPRRPDDHRRRRRGSRERGRPDDRGGEGHARSDQLHGAPRPRADLPVDDARAARRARDSADGLAEHVAVRDRRSACSIEAKGRTTTGISAADRAATVLAAIDPATQAVGSGAARPHVSAAGPHRRRDRARGADRGGGRSRADRRALSGRRHLRNHERRRHDGARAAAREVREEARPADDHDRGSDQVPHPHRVAGQARRVGEAADRVRRLPGSRVRESARQAGARRAGARRHRRRARTCWSACTRRA